MRGAGMAGVGPSSTAHMLMYYAGEAVLLADDPAQTLQLQLDAHTRFCFAWCST